MSPLARILLLLTALGVPGAAGAQAADAVRAAVSKALPFVEARGRAWIADRGCVSCHQVPSMLRSLEDAGARGFSVPRDFLDRTAEWSTHWEHWTNQGAKAGRTSAEASNVDTYSALLLTGAKVGAAWAEEARATLLRLQQPDGSWKPGGQLPLQDKPGREQREVTTLWVLLALRADPSATEQATSKARAFLAGAAAATTVERLALELLLAAEEGRPTDAAKARLLAAQSAEGGWPWKIGGRPDAFGTGLALHALARTGTAADDQAVGRARDFLLRSQKADGSWPVPGTRKKDAGKIKATATDWGTAWAVIGLLAWPPSSSR